MKTVTFKADTEFDALLNQLANRMSTTKSRIIRDAVRNYQQHLDLEVRDSKYESPHLKHESRHLMRQMASTRQIRMVCKRGGIYLANFNLPKDAEPGNVRPCIVMQSNLLNEVRHPSTTVLPLTTRLIEGAAPLRYRIAARDGLESDSDIMLDQTRTIDNQRFTSDMLIILTEKEIGEIEAYWRIVLGLD